MKNIRKIAVEILVELEDKNSNSTNLLNKYSKNLENLDANFLREIVYGTLENRMYIDYILKKLVKTRLKKLNKYILQILRISIYQIVFMDKVPEFASINESVNLTRSFKVSKFSSFVNGVLRTFLRSKDELTKIDTKDKNEYLAVKYSVNREIVDILVKEYSYKFAEEIFENSIGKPHFCIRISSFEKSEEVVVRELENLGYILIKSEFVKSAYIVENPSNILETELFENGDFTVQDIGSILTTEVLNPEKNSEILDICSAPGGKTAHIGFLTENTGNILANDIAENKLKKIKENLDRLNITNVETVSFDGCEFKEELTEKFDFILCDVICSGLGIIDRKPEIKLFRSYEEIKDIIQMQRSIFTNAFKYLKKGGTIVYSTCSILKMENEQNVEYFLENIKDIELEEVEFDGKNTKYINLFPIKNKYNGFFIAKFKKK